MSGEYSITAAGPGRWRARVSLGRHPETGKQIQPTKMIRATGIRDARRQALEWADRQRAAHTAGADRFGSVLDAYWKIKSPGWELSTQGTVADSIRIHIRPGLGPIPITELGPRDIARWQSELTGSATTRNNQTRQLVSILRWAARTGHLDRGHAADLRDALEPIRRSRRPAPPVGSVRQLLAAAAQREDPTIFLALWLAGVCGARRGELCGLRIRDFSPGPVPTITFRRSMRKDGTLKAIKGARADRTTPIDPATTAMVHHQIERVHQRHRAGWGLDVKIDPDWALLPPVNSTDHMRLNTLTSAVTKLRDHAGIPPIEIDGADRNSIWLHGLRHVTATLLRGAGVDPLVVQNRLGHTALATTDGYTTVLPAAEIAAGQIIGTIMTDLGIDTPAALAS